MEIFDFTVKVSYLFGVLILVFGILLRKADKITFQKSDIFLSLFLLYGFISIFWSADPKRAVVVWLLWLFVALIYKVIASYKFSREQRKKIIDIVLFSTLLVSLFGLYQFIADSLGISQPLTGLRYQYTKEILGFPRIQSVALEPLYFSNFLFVPLYLSLKKYFDQKRYLGSYFWLSALILANIFLGVSRGAYMALAITLLTLIVYFIIKKEWQKIYNTILLTVFSFMVSILLLLVLDGTDATKTYFNHIVVGDTGTEVSTIGRIDVYDSATETFNKNLMGIGISSWGVEHQGVVDYSDEKSYGNVNNQYLEILVETGILGFVLFILFLIFYIVEARKIIKSSDDKLLLIMMLLGLLAIFIQYNFFSTLYIIYIWAFLGLLKNQETNPKSQTLNSK